MNLKRSTQKNESERAKVSISKDRTAQTHNRYELFVLSFIFIRFGVCVLLWLSLDWLWLSIFWVPSFAGVKKLTSMNSYAMEMISRSTGAIFYKTYTRWKFHSQTLTETRFWLVCFFRGNTFVARGVRVYVCVLGTLLWKMYVCRQLLLLLLLLLLLSLFHVPFILLWATAYPFVCVRVLCMHAKAFFFNGGSCTYIDVWLRSFTFTMPWQMPDCDWTGNAGVGRGQF